MRPELDVDIDARELWWQLYPQLTAPGDGLTGHHTARAEAHTIRLALIYALLDSQRRIQPQHLQAALALCDYAARSAAWALAHATGDPLADQIHAALARSPDGLTRTQIRDRCQRNLPAERLEQALHALATAGRAQRQRTLTAGRPPSSGPPHSPAADDTVSRERASSPTVRARAGRGCAPARSTPRAAAARPRAPA